MKKSIKTKWVKALRSGKFVQGKDQLQDGETFCCLGVLATLVDPEQTTWKPGYGLFGDCERQGELLGGELSAEVTLKLTTFNDGFPAGNGRKSFKWIASWIERSKLL